MAAWLRRLTWNCQVMSSNPGSEMALLSHWERLFAHNYSTYSSVIEYPTTKQRRIFSVCQCRCACKIAASLCTLHMEQRGYLVGNGSPGNFCTVRFEHVFSVFGDIENLEFLKYFLNWICVRRYF